MSSSPRSGADLSLAMTSLSCDDGSVIALLLNCRCLVQPSISPCDPPRAHRSENQDACGRLHETPDRVLFASWPTASVDTMADRKPPRLAVEVTLEGFRDSPAAWSSSKRLATRAVQEANVAAIHDRAMIVTELRHMRSTLTARRRRRPGAPRRARRGLPCSTCCGAGLSCSSPRITPSSLRGFGWGSSGLTRWLICGTRHPHALPREVMLSSPSIAISRTLEGGDVLLVCSDGLYNTLGDEEARRPRREWERCREVCRALIDTANAMGTPDNVTAAVLRMSIPYARGDAYLARSEWPASSGADPDRVCPIRRDSSRLPGW